MRESARYESLQDLVVKTTDVRAAVLCCGHALRSFGGLLRPLTMLSLIKDY